MNVVGIVAVTLVSFAVYYCLTEIKGFSFNELKARIVTYTISPATRRGSPSPTMTDFLARESELLGDEFTGTPTGGSYATAGGEMDFDRAASAFPDISLDGTDDVPSFTAAPPASTGGFSFDDFSSPPRERQTDVKVTGDDEIEKFEDQFPDIEVPVRRASSLFDCT